MGKPLVVSKGAQLRVIVSDGLFESLDVEALALSLLGTHLGERASGTSRVSKPAGLSALTDLLTCH